MSHLHGLSWAQEQLKPWISDTRTGQLWRQEACNTQYRGTQTLGGFLLQLLGLFTTTIYPSKRKILRDTFGNLGFSSVQFSKPSVNRTSIPCQWSGRARKYHHLLSVTFCWFRGKARDVCRLEGASCERSRPLLLWPTSCMVHALPQLR